MSLMRKPIRKAPVFPVTLKQKFMLDQAANPNCPDDLRDRWILSHVLLVRPKIDVRRFRRAIDKVSERHDSLRLRFARKGGSWQACIDPPGGNVIREIDLGDLDDEAFHAELSAIVKAPMPLLDAPLAEITIAKCGKRGDVLITRLHHAITDGYGMIILVEDLIKYLIGVPILGKAVSFEDYVTRYQSPLPGRRAETDAFWERMHRDFPQVPDVGRKAKGLEPLVDCMGEIEKRQIEFRAKPKSIERLEAKAGAENLSANTVIMAGYLESLCQAYSLDRLMFMTHIARTEPGLETYMGDHTLDAVLPYRTGGTKGFALSTQNLADTLNQALAHLPSDYARRGTAYEKAMFDAGCYPGQFCVYSPRAVIRQNRSAFSEGFHAEHGQEQRLGPFSLTSLDVPGCKRILAEVQIDLGGERVRTGFEIKYDGLAYTEAEIHDLGVKSADLLGLDLAQVVVS